MNLKYYVTAQSWINRTQHTDYLPILFTVSETSKEGMYAVQVKVCVKISVSMGSFNRNSSRLKITNFKWNTGNKVLYSWKLFVQTLTFHKMYVYQTVWSRYVCFSWQNFGEFTSYICGKHSNSECNTTWFNLCSTFSCIKAEMTSFSWRKHALYNFFSA